MTTVGNVYALIEDFKRKVTQIAEAEDVSDLLIWMLMRQVADHELLRIKEAEGLLENSQSE